ncbi:MAG: histidine phosphatase family protein [Caldilineaceae bacterium]
MHFRTVGAFVEDLLARHQQQTVLVITYNRVIELVFDHMFNIGPWRRCEIAVQHTAITHFEQINLPRREHWRLHCHNCIEHLAQVANEENACS